MSGFQGMNTAEVTDLAGLFSERAQALSTLLETLDGRVGDVVGTQWIGHDADDFAAAFRSAVHSRLTTAAETLTARGNDLEAHVQEQDAASGADGTGSSGAEVGAGVGAGARAGGAAAGGAQNGPGAVQASVAANFLGADWGDISFGEFWDNWKENIGVDGADSAGTILGTAHSFVKNFGEFAMGKGSVPAFIPMIGDGFTGIMAGIDRWNDDAGRSDLSTGERIGRAVADGGANFVGSLAGSFIGGWAGSSLGASVGGLFGGGGGAAAGAPVAGAGAVPGAAVGGGTGAVVGGVAGGVFGDVFGSYLGATTADAVIDSFLD